MIVLLMFLLLSNLWFGWAAGSTGASNPFQSDVYEVLEKFLGQLQNEQRAKKETCSEIKSALGNLAASMNWEVKADQYGVMSIKLPNGETFVINEDCKVVVSVLTGTLSPLKEGSAVSLAQGTLTMENFTFKVDVGLFRTLFLMLMYAAGIFWAVRAAQRLIAGELTEMLITLFIGFIIIATMYVLYRWMPA